MLVTLCSGCAWRSATAEHYFGPVFFRFNPGDGNEPSTTQIVAVGALGEAGRQWGVSLGVVDRIIVVPRSIKGTTAQEPEEPRRWIVEPGVLGPPRSGAWNFSPVYLRVDGLTDGPRLVSRRLHGAQLVAGAESRALSLGFVSVTYVTPPENAISVLHYDSSAPLATRFLVWHVDAGDELPPLDVLKGLP